MPRGKAKQDTETLAMALVGFEKKKEEIDEKIRHIKGLLGQGKTTTTKKASAAAPDADVPKKRRTLSAAARKRIAIAQKRRWAEHRKSLAAAE